MTTRQTVVAKIKQWIGYSEANGQYKKIIDIYNSYSPLPQGVKMQYDWAWCACTWSAVQMCCKTTSVAPIEISCPRIIEEAKKMGCWQENDAYSPKPGDAVLYDWQDIGTGDNQGNPDHIGMVVENDGKNFKVVEGNMSGKVGTRTMQINGKYIRGFITPNYELLDAKTETTEAPKETEKKEETTASAPAETKNDTPEVNTPAGARFFDKAVAGKYKVKSRLNLRVRPGIDASHTVVEIMNVGTIVQCFGYYSTISGIDWLYVKTAEHEGFCQGIHLEKV